MIKTMIFSVLLWTALASVDALAVERAACPVSQPPYQQNVVLPDMQEGYLKTSGGSMFFRYLNSDSNRPLVILAPGLPSALYFSDLVLRLSENRYNVLSFDYPGKTSSEVKGREDIRFLAEQIGELFKSLDIEKHPDWHIVGTSMGGVVAAQLALNYQSHVRSLTLMNPVGLKAHWTLLQKMAFVPVINKIVAPFIMKSEVKKDIQNALACPENYENLLNEQDQFLATIQSRWNYLNLVSNFGMRDNSAVYAKLANQKMRILVTAGEPNLDHFADQTNQLKKLVPNATYVSIQRTSHIPFVENPDETFEILRQFIEAPSLGDSQDINLESKK
jgi:pimeloyl-ACP methyl ester carboxylesterase